MPPSGNAWAGHCSTAAHGVLSSYPLTTLHCFYYSHFSGEQAEVPKSHIKDEMKLRSEPLWEILPRFLLLSGPLRGKTFQSFLACRRVALCSLLLLILCSVCPSILWASPCVECNPTSLLLTYLLGLKMSSCTFSPHPESSDSDEDHLRIVVLSVLQDGLYIFFI